MHDVNWWLMTLAFLLGLLLTLALTIRKVTREVPVNRIVSTPVAKPHVAKPDLGKVAGAAAVGGAALAGTAKKVEKKAETVEKKVAAKAETVEKKVAAKVEKVEKKVAAKVDVVEKKVDKKVDHILEKEPYGAGSIRVSARTVAPAGYTIKGDKDTGRYFTLDSPEYEAIEAEVWFANEESAAKAGFLRWDAKGTRKAGLLSPPAAETVVTEKHLAAETVITEQHSTADSTLVIVDDGVPETKTVIVDDGIPETKIRIVGVDD